MSREWTTGDVFVVRHAGMPFDWVEYLAAPAALLAAADSSPSEPDTAFLECFAEADRHASAELASVVADEKVREAILLSNPDVYHNMLMPFLAESRPLNARWRRVRRQLYTYLQRFCAKNETVSFFGPMGYGTAVPGDGVRLRTGRPQRRQVFLSHWSVEALARAVAADRRLLAELPFRVLDPAWPEHELEIRRAITEQGTSLRRICEVTGIAPRAAAVRLRSLVEQGRLEFGVTPDADEPRPLRRMVDRLGRLPASPARDEWVARLSALDDMVQRLAAAPLDERVRLVPALEAAFTEATGQPARRGQGVIYADRAVFYEECSSQFELAIGQDVLRRWTDRLSAAMEASTAHGAAAQRAARERVRAVLGQGTRLNLLEYSQKLLDAVDPAGSRFAADHVPVYPAEHAADRLTSLAATARHLPGDRYALIDLCPVSGTVDELAKAPLVLSRTHHHLLTDGWLATMYDDRRAFARSAREWLAGRPELTELDPGRRNKGYYRFPGRRVALRGMGPADAADLDVWSPDQVTVEVTGDEVRCWGPDGQVVQLYLSLSDYVKYPPYAALSHPQVLHAPFTGPGDVAEVSVDGGVTYQRARWRLDPRELATASRPARFLALRRFAARTGAGRFVFCRTDRERKPYLIDLESVLGADLMGHIARNAGWIQAERMRPGPDELWLRDEHGLRYTCELRMQLIGRDQG